MPVTFHIPGALREFTNGRSRVEIEVAPKTVSEALSALWTLYPGVRDRVANEQGQVREHINIFIGDENVRYTGGLRESPSRRRGDFDCLRRQWWLRKNLAMRNPWKPPPWTRAHRRARSCHLPKF